jgi:hypothetical protein
MRTTTSTRTACALTTAVLCDDRDALALVLADAPPLPVLLAETAVLLRQAARASVCLLRDEADAFGMLECTPPARLDLAGTLAKHHGFGEDVELAVS